MSKCLKEFLMNQYSDAFPIIACYKTNIFQYICLFLSHLLELKEHLVQISFCISASLAKMKRILTKGPLGLRLPFCTEDIALLFNQTNK